jgi:hypothetical protein
LFLGYADKTSSLKDDLILQGPQHARHHIAQGHYYGMTIYESFFDAIKKSNRAQRGRKKRKRIRTAIRRRWPRRRTRNSFCATKNLRARGSHRAWIRYRSRRRSKLREQKYGTTLLKCENSGWCDYEISFGNNSGCSFRVVVITQRRM